jgi:hypothetical protein
MHLSIGLPQVSFSREKLRLDEGILPVTTARNPSMPDAMTILHTNAN